TGSSTPLLQVAHTHTHTHTHTHIPTGETGGMGETKVLSVAHTHTHTHTPTHIPPPTQKRTHPQVFYLSLPHPHTPSSTMGQVNSPPLNNNTSFYPPLTLSLSLPLSLPLPQIGRASCRERVS